MGPGASLDDAEERKFFSLWDLKYDFSVAEPIAS
jgi:hypothetical protein